MKIETYFGDNPARKFRKEFFLLSKKCESITRGRTSMQIICLMTCSVSCHHHTTGRGKKSWTLEYSNHTATSSQCPWVADTLENNIPECCRMINALAAFCAVWFLFSIPSPGELTSLRRLPLWCFLHQQSAKQFERGKRSGKRRARRNIL